MRTWLRRLRWPDWAWIAAFVAIFVLGLPLPGSVEGLPLAGGVSRFFLAVLVLLMLHAILALGLNLVVGTTGLLDLGYASFVAIGAFTVSVGLVLTDQREEAFPGLSVRELRLTQAQRDLAPLAPGEPAEEVVVRRRPDLAFDVLQGERTVLRALAATAPADRRVDARHMSGLTLPVGQTTAQGTQPFRFPGGYFVLLFLAGAVCALAGLLRGFPTLRLTGDYYAIVTLGFAEIVWLVTLNEGWLTGGAFGIRLDPYRPSLLGARLFADSWQFFLLVLGCLLLAVLLSHRLQRSRVGRAWAAIKADETAARASGIDVDRAKLLAFAVSGFVGGVAGGLYALKLGTVTARQFDVWLSIVVVACLVLGGTGSIRGAIAGTALLMSLAELLRDRVPPEARNLVYGLVLVLIMRFRPQGLLPPGGGGPQPGKDELDALRAAESPLFVVGTAAAPAAAAPSAPP